jgi:hypothetical protein
VATVPDHGTPYVALLDDAPSAVSGWTAQILKPALELVERLETVSVTFNSAV